MLRRTTPKRRIKKNRSGVAEEVNGPVVLNKLKNKVNSGFYKSGPMLTLPGGTVKQSANTHQQVPENLPSIKGSGSASEKTNKATSVTLEGETHGQFDGGSFETQNVRVSRAEGCEACSSDDPCIRARGTLVARYHVTTTVTLPSVDDFPYLTPCQRERVQQAIDNVLAPHEQEHVHAFEQYNGVVRTPFDVTLCRSDFDSTIQDMFDTQETNRRNAAQDASDELDPFTFTVDIDCDEPADESSPSPASNSAEAETETEEVEAHATAEPANETQTEETTK